MNTIATIDGLLATITQNFFLILGLWGLFRAIRGQSTDGSYLGALVIAEILIVLALIFDVILWIGGIVPDRAGLHYLYSIFAVLLMPFIFASVLRGEESNQAQWIFAFVTLFLFGVAARLIAI